MALVAVLSFILVLSADPKLAYANPVGQDTWGLTANTGYVDLRTAVDCNSDLAFYGGDTDHDGICDHWEDGTNGNGLHIRVKNTAYAYDLTCNPSANYTTDPTGLTVCPNPNQKDVYVELDWMQGHGPDPTAITDVVKAFNSAPNGVNPGANPPRGVQLHVQYGENPSSSDGNTGVHVTNLKTSTALASTNTSPTFGFWVLKENRFGTVAERNTNDPNHNSFCANGESWHDCGSAKRQVFHYGVYIHKQSEFPTSSGWGEINGNDFVMSLGALTSPGIDEQEASFMHELGHNLGLYHGGSIPPDVNNNHVYDPTDDNADNCKPNYPSIMNYMYEFRSTFDQCRPLNFTNTALGNLDESNLSDDNGVGSNPYPNPDPDPPGAAAGTCNNAAHNGMERPINFSNPHPPGGTTPSLTGTPSIDWNGNGMQPGVTYTQNINTFAICNSFTTTNTVLKGHNDWTGGDMNYNFRAFANVFQSNDTTNTETCENCPNSVIEPAPPGTYIDTTPPQNTANTTASFTFHSDAPYSTFDCQLDNNQYSTCSSPQSYTSLSANSHTFSVRSTSNGMTEISPPTYTWTVTDGGGGQITMLEALGIIIPVVAALTVPIIARRK